MPNAVPLATSPTPQSPPVKGGEVECKKKLTGHCELNGTISDDYATNRPLFFVSFVDFVANN